MVVGYLYYRFSCPRCKLPYATKLSPVVLGSGHRTCKLCRTTFDDNSRHWSELRTGQKFEYFFPATVLGCVLGACVIAALAVYMSLDDDIRGGLQLAGYILAVGVGVWVPYFLLRLWGIGRDGQKARLQSSNPVQNG